MAANKFATMLHRNTNKITLILVYALLEWTLIVLLLLNSLFSYLIIKFADYFGLKKPCLWCSRLDHVFEPGKSKNSHRDLICEAHATEISQLGYCLNHRKLAESRDMCEDCSSSSSSDEWSKKFAFFPWMKQIGMIKDGGHDDDDVDDKEVVENGEESFMCSCCGVSLKDKYYPPCILFKPSWGVLDYAQKNSLVEEAGIDAQTDDGDHISYRSGSVFVAENHEDEQSLEENRGDQSVFDGDRSSGGGESKILCREILADEDEQVNEVMEKEEEEKEEAKEEDDEEEEDEEKEEEAIKEESLDFFFGEQPCELTKVQESSGKDVPAQHLEFYIGQEDCTLIPIESTSNKNRTQLEYMVEDQGKSGNQDLILDFDMNVITQVEQITETWISSGETLDLLSPSKSIESSKFGESRSSFVFHGEQRDSETREVQKASITQATQTPSDDDEDGENDNVEAMAGGESDLDVHQASEDESHMQSYEIDAEVSIGTDIPDHEPIDEIQAEESQPSSYPCVQEDPSSSSVNLHTDDKHDFKQAEKELVEFKALSVETNCREFNSHSAFFSELNDIDEDKVPDTPTSTDSLPHLHKKLLSLERRESGTEESLDGSVVSDIEGGDGILTVEKLKSALKAERKALNELYTELEEERSASAVAASQTLAMINRLQEEKAAMQMEAFQYQRMMEEQSEYDQEALQLLNELMMKREREKQELEKELEIYRKRIQDYEAKEKMMVRRMRDGSTRSRTSSVSCSNAEDSDELSIDLNHEAKEGDCVEGHEEISNQNTPADAVLYLEESLASFEEERLSILDQLRVLEEKLFTLQSEEEDRHFEDIKPIEHLYKENGNGYHESLGLSNEVNGIVTNGHSKEMNGKHHHQERRIMGSKAKRLLPFFDATEEETEDGVLNGNGEGLDYVPMQNYEFERESKKLVIEEEVDHVYERLQALESDREFLKHCISSLRKGDKGLYLLQEILQHLRDLRSVELRVRNMGDGSL